jgi:DNA-binding NtrC family response regulator
MLLVEDDERIRTVLAQLLRPYFKVQEAIDGASAEYWIGVRRFDVAFVDYTLPDTNGIDLLRRMRAANPFVRRVITSGSLLPELFPLPCDGLIYSFVLKPASIDEIVWACGGMNKRRSRLTL